ncbi:murein L,D-transpeptidase [Marinobacter sp. MDS2]|uniref:L,D-transpeptidase family protein n=1 Tax=Marinobacter sp. MDS2 TaxID=3065961 RepID=UPI00273B9E08|nr:L,D-transpeptidase family protein [Marinobacter sp. MDS2]MDP4547097.1 L,D-transpeptidase family protein [Marinobacter sp. MDS2]
MQDAESQTNIKSCLLIIMLLAFVQNAQSDDGIINRLEILQSDHSDSIQGTPLHAQDALARFYENRHYQPAWSSPIARYELVQAIDRVAHDGLNPADYHQDALHDIVHSSSDDADRTLSTELDLIFTDAFLLLAAHLRDGKVNSQTLQAQWAVHQRQEPLFLALEQALQDETVFQTLQSFKPPAPAYQKLSNYRYQLSGLLGRPWPLHDPGPTIHPGDSDPRIPAIRQQLQLLGNLPPADHDSHYSATNTPESQRYAGSLIEAIPAFQARHGLEPDGLIGRKTLQALNTLPIERIRQIDANLERWRWLPDSLGDTYVLVNIAGYDMVLVEDGEEVMHQRVIVGDPFRQTPVFSDRIRYLVFNPTWTVPRTLMIKDQLPKLQADPSYLSRMNFKVYKGWGASRVEVAPEEIDWNTLTADHFPYQLIQQPGPNNSLGQVKFMFPNKHAIYLHDTPGQYHFSREQRTISSGCIRVERPFELAERLLTRNSSWTKDTIRQARQEKEPVKAILDRSVPVHLQYWTTWVDKSGHLQIRKDVYGRDRRLVDALRSDFKGNLQLTPRSHR